MPKHGLVSILTQMIPYSQIMGDFSIPYGMYSIGTALSATSGQLNQSFMAKMTVWGNEAVLPIATSHITPHIYPPVLIECLNYMNNAMCITFPISLCVVKYTATDSP